MAFFTGPSEEVFAQRLKRSASIDKLHRTRTRSTSSSITSPPDATPPVPSSHTNPPSLRNPSAPSSLRRHAASAGDHVAKAGIASPSTTLHATRPSTSANIVTLGPSDPEFTPFPSRVAAGSSPRRVHHTPSASDLRGDRQVSHSLDASSPLASAASRLHIKSLSSSLSDSGHRSPQDNTSSLSPGHTRLFTRSDSRMHPPVSPSRYGVGSGNHSDGNTSCSDHGSSSPLPSHHLDVKRLLSKPAAPSRGSVYSITSDSEGSPVNRQSNPYALSSSHPISTAPWLGFNKEARLAAAADRQHLHTPSRASSADASRARPSTSPLMSPVGYSPTSSSPRSHASHEQGREKETEKAKGERSPRVLRKPRSPGLQLASRASLAPSPSGTKGSSSPSSASTATRRPGDARASTLPSPRSPRAAETPDSPRSKLTPAAAFAQAYKQQETRRDGLAAEAVGGPSPPVSPRSPGHSRRGASESAVPKKAASPEPYFTVYGSGVGSPFDASFRSGSSSSGKLTPASTPVGTVRRSLVRKVSGRFTRHKSSPSFSAAVATELPAIPSVKSRSSEAKSRSSGAVSQERSRRSLQERRSMSLPKDRGKNLRLSLDDSFVQVERDVDTSPDKERKQDEGAGSSGAPGIKLWRLVKRLSSNGLRDRYQATVPSALPSPPPPVPAIPKELLQTPKHPSLSTTSTPKSSRPSPRVSTSATNTPESTVARGRRPSAAPQKASPASATTPKSRRSITTRSSSPYSSSSTRFFPRPPSPRSSASSIADVEVPPLPASGQVGKQILSPRALRLLGQYNELPEISQLPALEIEPFSVAGLPHPPRRPRVLSDSPEMPTFSIAGSVNNFAARKTPTTSPTDDKDKPATARRNHTVSLDRARSPPPRPVRSPHRPSAFFPVPEDLPEGQLFDLTPPVDQLSSEPALMPASAPPPDAQNSLAWTRSESESGHSQRTTSTARPETVMSFSRSRSPSAGAGLTFREMGTFGPRTAMSEREKDALWDDLLERSAQAGGTLHLGNEGGGLLSDSLRFSTVSSGSAATSRFL